MTKIVELLKREPVRVYLYTLVTVVTAALVVFGVIAASAVPVIAAVMAALLALPSPVESLRSRVTPAVESVELTGVLVAGEPVVSAEPVVPAVAV